MILDLNQRLNCEQTDQVIYENKIKSFESDTERLRAQVQHLLKQNNEISHQYEEMKRADRDLQLRNELLQN